MNVQEMPPDGVRICFVDVTPPLTKTKRWTIHPFHAHGAGCRPVGSVASSISKHGQDLLM
jgi:hypothetical protein